MVADMEAEKKKKLFLADMLLHMMADKVAGKASIAFHQLSTWKKGQSLKHSAFTPFPPAFGQRVTPLVEVCNDASSLSMMKSKSGDMSTRSTIYVF